MKVIIAPVVNITAVPSLPQPVESQAILLDPALAVALMALTCPPLEANIPSTWKTYLSPRMVRGKIPTPYPHLWSPPMKKTILTLLVCLSLSACCAASQDHTTYTHTETTPGKTIVLENTSTSEHKTGEEARMEMERMDAEHAMGHMHE